ncbi:MAG: hypothetical protein AAGB12_02035 [Pseudomonadota bacterium]
MKNVIQVTFISLIGVFTYTLASANDLYVVEDSQIFGLPETIVEQNEKDAMVDLLIMTVRAVYREMTDEEKRHLQPGTLTYEFKDQLREQYEENKMDYSRYRALYPDAYNSGNGRTCINLFDASPLEVYKKVSAAVFY